MSNNNSKINYSSRYNIQNNNAKFDLCQDKSPCDSEEMPKYYVHTCYNPQRCPVSTACAVPEKSCCHKDCCAEILEYVAEIEKSIACILDCEGKKLQHVLECSCDFDKIMCVNREINNTIINVTSLEQSLYSTLVALNNCCKFCPKPCKRCRHKDCYDKCKNCHDRDRDCCDKCKNCHDRDRDCCDKCKDCHDRDRDCCDKCKDCHDRDRDCCDKCKDCHDRDRDCCDKCRDCCDKCKDCHGRDKDCRD